MNLPSTETIQKVTFIARIFKWLFIMFLILCITTGGITCGETKMTLRSCNPDGGINFDQEKVFKL